MLAHPAHILAQGFGSGLSRIMPGTVGTLFGWLSFYVLSTRWPLLFTPMHIAFLEIVIDPVCSIVFEAEDDEPDAKDTKAWVAWRNRQIARKRGTSK